MPGGSYGLDEMSAWAALAVLAVIAEPKSAVTCSAPSGSAVSSRGFLRWPACTASRRVAACPPGCSEPTAIRTSSQQHRRWHCRWRSALFVERGIGPVRIRWLAVAAIAVLIVTVFQTYSRSGLLAAAGGSYVTIVLLVPTAQRRRTALTLAAVGVIAGIVLYPSFARLRTDADFGSAIAAAREVDRSGWSPASTGVISAGPSKLENAGPDVLRGSVPSSERARAFPSARRVRRASCG